MFSLKNPICHQLVQVNLISEMHGKVAHTAVDLIVKVEAGCLALNLFYPDLRDSFYVADPQNDGKVTKLRYPRLGQLAINWEYTGRVMVLDYGLGGDGTPELDFGGGDGSNLRQEGVRIKGFKADLQEEGRMILEYHVIVPKASPEVIGQLGTLKKHKIWLALPVNAEYLSGLADDELSFGGAPEPEGGDGEGEGDPEPGSDGDEAPDPDPMTREMEYEGGEGEHGNEPVATDEAQSGGAAAEEPQGAADNDDATEAFIRAHAT